MARTGKPHTIVEGIILPAATDKAETMLGEKAKKTTSNNTVSRRIRDMAGDVLKQLLLRIQACDFHVLQLVGSKDVAILAQLLVYVCYVYGGSIKEAMLFCKPLQTRTT